MRTLVFGLVLALQLTAGCSKLGYTRVGEDVYVAKSSPSLQKAAEEISTARQATRVADPGRAGPELVSVNVNPSSGLGPGAFRVQVEKAEVLVEGGDAAGAMYGALTMARFIREGRSIATLSLPDAHPLLPLRVVRLGIGVPGVSAQPARTDWGPFLDRLAAAYINVVVVPCDHVFPSLVRLSRYPKAFQGLAVGGPAGYSAFREFLQLASERNLKVILCPSSIAAPESFVRLYADKREDGGADSELCRSYVRECWTETLKSFPLLAGIGVGKRSLDAIQVKSPSEYLRSVHVQAMRATGRKGLLFIEEDLAPVLDAESGLQAEAELILERPWNVRGIQTASEARAASGEPAAGSKRCVRIPWQALSPSLPAPETIRAVLLAGRLDGPDGFVVDLLGAPLPVGYPGDRAMLGVATCGMAAFEPGMDAVSRAFLWRDVLGPGTDEVAGAADRLACLWLELANFHAPVRGWDPLTATEDLRDPGALRAPRDASRFVSLMEFAFSPCMDPSMVSIPEFVAAEVVGAPPPGSRRTPLEVSDVLLTGGEQVLSALGESEGSRGAGDAPLEARAAARIELEAMAQLARFHGHRIRAGVFLVRHMTGRTTGEQQVAREEIAKAISSWSRATGSMKRLRADFPGGSVFPDLEAWRRDVESDARIVDECLADPDGFRASPLTTAWPLAEDFDYRVLAGFLCAGTSVFGRPPVRGIDPAQLIEAEDLAGQWMTLREVAGHSGRGYITSGGEQPARLPVILRISVEQPGLRQVWVRALGGVGRGIRVRAASGDLKPTHAQAEDAAGFTWERAGEVDLKGGENFLQVADDGAGQECVDAIVLTRDAQWVPPTF